MSELPATPASALTRATEQLQGLDLRDDRQPERPEGPLSAAAAELLLLGELAGQQLATLGRMDRWRSGGPSVEGCRSVTPAWRPRR